MQLARFLQTERKGKKDRIGWLHRESNLELAHLCAAKEKPLGTKISSLLRIAPSTFGFMTRDKLKKYQPIPVELLEYNILIL